jgi:hypothetical protein
MMQMLNAGGIPALTDGARTPDEDNPRGYFELDRAKRIRQDKAWLEDAAGKAVKLVHLLLYELPLHQNCRIIFMRRDLQEVLASQKRMLVRQGKQGAQLSDEQMSQAFDDQVGKVLNWVRLQPNFTLLEVHYRDLVTDPTTQARRINEFLGGGLNEPAMIAAVDPSLYRNRSADKS